MSATMSKTDTVPLRASCDRCRAQKLRCVPSSHHPAAPCQRCLRAKTPKSCVFSRRSRTGRSARSGSISANGEAIKSSSSTARKDKELWLPGTSTFMLHTTTATTNSSPESAVTETSQPPTARALVSPTSPRSESQLNTFHLEDSVADESLLGQTLVDLWDQDHDSAALGRLFGDVSLHPPATHLFDIDAAPLPSRASTSEPRDSISESPNADTHYTYDQPPGQHGHHLANYQEFRLSPVEIPGDNSVELSNPMDIDLFAVPEKPGPLIDLTTLLAEMSHYENQLSKLSHSGTAHDLDDYPIGDALFLSQRFYAILSEYPPSSSSSDHPPTSPPASPSSSPSSPSHSHRPPPPLDTLLPTITCYLTLTRIYSSIISFLLAHLSTIPSHPDHEYPLLSKTSHGHHTGSAAHEMHAYRGRRLGQLKEMCLCAGWDPVPRARNAVAMLLGSLGGAERVLGLPGDVRVVLGVREEQGGKAAGGAAGRGEKKEGRGRRRMLPFEENGRLYRAVREQARELRGKVREVDGLLKRLL